MDRRLELVRTTARRAWRLAGLGAHDEPERRPIDLEGDHGAFTVALDRDERNVLDVLKPERATQLALRDLGRGRPGRSAAQQRRVEPPAAVGGRQPQPVIRADAAVATI